MDSFQKPSYHIGLIQWAIGNGIGEAIHSELTQLGHRTEYFQFNSKIPNDIDIAFLYGPFGKYLSILQQIESIPVTHRPTVVFWNTEGLPDPKIPWPLVNTVGACRSWLGRLDTSNNPWARSLACKSPMSVLDERMIRFRYLGDFFYAQKKGWINVFADISAVYTQFFNKHNLPTIAVPFGSFADWYADLNLKRDIDVLWMGKRATKRRGLILDKLRQELRRRGIEIHIVDNVENPFVFGKERTRLLNRAKITLNLLRTWYDENSLRICLAAPNKSLIVSEPLLPHVPYYEVGTHYVSAPLDKLADTIVYYLKHSDERLRMVENAYQLLVSTLTMKNSISTIIEAVNQVKCASNK